MITLMKYAIRIVLQILALFGLTFIYSAEKVNDIAFEGEGNEMDILLLITAGIISGLIATIFLLNL